MSTDARSNSSTTCGHCGGVAFTPDHFTSEADLAELDGMFNVCSECGAECTGTEAYTETDRWIWTGEADAARGRAGLQAAMDDAERHQELIHGDW